MNRTMLIANQCDDSRTQCFFGIVGAVPHGSFMFEESVIESKEDNYFLNKNNHIQVS